MAKAGIHWGWIAPFIGLMLVTFVACAARGPTITYSPLRSVQLVPKPAEDVEVFITNSPTRQYEELGILTMKVWSRSPDELRVVDLFRGYAAQLGADGLIMMESRTGSAANSATKITYAYTDFRGMVFRYTD